MASGAKQQHVFITGGASGLGLALARQYLADGWRVAIGDRNQPALDQVLQSELKGALGFVCDVTREQDLEQVRDKLVQQWGRIDLVFNNAGVAVAGTIEETPISDWEWIVQINLLGVARGCKVFAPLLRRQKSGRIVNIGSMAGLLYPPTMAAYCATKAAVVALSQVMEVEFAGSGVAVSVVCPSFFRTALSRTGRAASPELQQVADGLVAHSKVSADAVAARIRAGVKKGRFFILTHRKEQWAWWLKRLLPHALFAPLMIAGVRFGMSRQAGVVLPQRTS